MDLTRSIVAIPILALIGVILTVYVLAWIARLRSATVFVNGSER